VAAGTFQTVRFLGDTDGIKQLFPEIVHEFPAGKPFHQRTQHKGAAAVIFKQSAGGAGRVGVVKVGLHTIVTADSEPVLCPSCGGHHQHMPDGLGLHIGVLLVLHFLGKIAGNGVIQIQKPVLPAETDGDGHKAFGNRIHTMEKVPVEGFPVGKGDNIVSPGDIHGVRGKMVVFQKLIIFQKLCRMNADIFGNVILHTGTSGYGFDCIVPQPPGNYKRFRCVLGLKTMTEIISQDFEKSP